MELMTNILEPIIDHNAICSTFDVIELSHIALPKKEDNWKIYEKIRRKFSPLSTTRVGDNFLVLVPKDADRVDFEEGRQRKLTPHGLKAYPDYLILRLLILLIPSRSSTLVPKTNEYPRYLYYVAEIKKKELITLRVNIAENNSFRLSASTFILADYEKGAKKKLAYILSGDKLAPYSKMIHKDTPKYVQKKMWKKKTSFPFAALDINYPKSRIYFYHRFMEDVKAYLSEFLTLNNRYVDMQLFTNGAHKDARNQMISDTITGFFKKRGGIQIVDLRHRDEDKKIDATKLQKNLEDLLGEERVFTRSEIVPDKPAIVILHPKETYEDENGHDPYSSVKQSPVTTQVITDEAAADSTVARVLLKELCIKEEIREGALILPYHIPSEGYTFVNVDKKNSEDDENKENHETSPEEEYSFTKALLRDKRISFEELSEEEEDKMLDIVLSIEPEEARNIEAIILSDRGDINYIAIQNFQILPDLEYIDGAYKEHITPFYVKPKELIALWDMTQNDEEQRETLIKGLQEHLRDSESGVDIKAVSLQWGRNFKAFKNRVEKHYKISLTFNMRRSEHKNAIASIIGLKYAENREDGYAIYTSSVSDRNIKQQITTNARVRKIVAYEGELLAKEVMEMMDEYFVKNKELTALPFPIKYAREYAKEAKAKEELRIQPGLFSVAND